MKNRFNITEEEKNRIKSLHNIKLINEQWTEVEMEGEPQEVGEQTRNLDKVKSTDSGSAKDNETAHEEFMTKLCGMDIVAMGDKMVGRRKCDGNKSDGSGGCYEPLIKLIKEYCKNK